MIIVTVFLAPPECKFSCHPHCHAHELILCYLPWQIYEDIANQDKLKKTMTDFLDEYNSAPGIVAMDLVLFKDAIEHRKSL